jgi:hypothetical protein
MFDPKRLVPIDEVVHEHVCTVTLRDDVGMSIIASSLVDHLRLVGVLDDYEVVIATKQGNTLTISVAVPVFNTDGLFEEN